MVRASELHLVTIGEDTSTGRGPVWRVSSAIGSSSTTPGRLSISLAEPNGRGTCLTRGQGRATLAWDHSGSPMLSMRRLDTLWRRR